MCRLALMNRAAIDLLGADVASFFAGLESTQGGDGNGIAALWSKTGEVKIRKGLTFTTAQAAAKVAAYATSGADWVLFHTRRATSGGKTTRHCQPFQSGQLVLAHNGHAYVWHKLGASLGISDSECITRVWSRLDIPLAALEDVEGVFLGFHYGYPFVIKGGFYDALTVSVQEKTGAILFASELDESLRLRFDHTIEAGRFLWSGGALDIWKIEPGPITLKKAPSYPGAPTPFASAWMTGQSGARQYTFPRRPSVPRTSTHPQERYQRIDWRKGDGPQDAAAFDPKDPKNAPSSSTESK